MKFITVWTEKGERQLVNLDLVSRIIRSKDEDSVGLIFLEDENKVLWIKSPPDLFEARVETAELNEVKGENDLNAPSRNYLRNRRYPRGNKRKPRTAAARLEQLDPLPILHYMYRLNAAYIADANNHATMFQLGRIMGGLGVFGLSVSQANLNITLDILRDIHVAHPTAWAPDGPGVFFNCRPWTTEGGQMTGPCLADPQVTTCDANEITLWTNRFNTLKSWVDTWNTANSPGAPVPVIGVIQETETWATQGGAWDTAMIAKFDAIYDLAKATWPGVRYEHYVTMINGIFPAAAKHDSDSVNIYRPTLPQTQNLKWSNALAAKVKPKLNPWISIGFTYDPANLGAAVTKVENGIFVPLYDTDWSRRLGRQMCNPRYSPPPGEPAYRTNLDRVMIYPQISDVRSSMWMDHFLEYCLGAQETNPEG